MSATLPPVLTLYRLVEAHAKGMEPRVLVFGDTPPDESSRDVPYVVVEADPGFDAIARADGSVSSRRGRFSLRCCGSSWEQACLALDAARERFRDWRPYESLRFGAARETDAMALPVDKNPPTDPRWAFRVTYDVDD